MGGRGRRIFEFKASLVYRVSYKTARATQRNPVLKTKTENRQNKTKIPNSKTKVYIYLKKSPNNMVGSSFWSEYFSKNMAA